MIIRLAASGAVHATAGVAVGLLAVLASCTLAQLATTTSRARSAPRDGDATKT